MAKENNYGVDSIKQAMTITAALVKTSYSADTNNDGKIDKTERNALVSQILPQLFPIYGIAGGIAQEVTDKVTDEEWNELVDHAVRLDFLPEGREIAEEYVKTVFLWINYNRRFVNKSIAFFSERKLPEIKKVTTKTVGKEIF